MRTARYATTTSGSTASAPAAAVIARAADAGLALPAVPLPPLVSKKRIYELTGIARTTLDRIEKNGASRPRAGAAGDGARRGA